MIIACVSRPNAVLEWVEERGSHYQPDSLKVKAEIRYAVPTQPSQAKSPQEKGSVTAYFYVVPKQRYRIELKGPLGIHVASILWTSEQWEVWIPNEETLWRGQGSQIRLPIPGLEAFNIHQFVQSLWGDVLAPGWQEASYIDEGQTTTLQWTHQGVQYQAIIANQRHQVQEVQYQAKTIRYKHWAQQDSLTYPELTHFVFSPSELWVDVEEVDQMPQWSERLWTLRVPPSTQLREFYSYE